MNSSRRRYEEKNRTKRINRDRFRKITGMLLLCMMISCAAGIISSNRVEAAAGISETNWAELRQMFPDGRCWNHVGVSDAEYQANTEYYNSTYSDYACDDTTGANLQLRHQHGSCIIDKETCGCNCYDGAI